MKGNVRHHDGETTFEGAQLDYRGIRRVTTQQHFLEVSRASSSRVERAAALSRHHRSVIRRLARRRVLSVHLGARHEIYGWMDIWLGLLAGGYHHLLFFHVVR